MYRQCIFSNKIAVKEIDWYDVNCIITHPADSRQCIRILLTPDHQYIPFWDIGFRIFIFIFLFIL